MLRVGRFVTSTAFAAFIASAGAASASVVAQWDFNGQSSTTVPGGGTSPSPSTGSGSASLLSGVTGSFSSGASNGGSSDPVTTSPPNYGWQTTNYPAQGTGSGTAGVRFDVSTAGVTGPELYAYFDVRHSNTSSRFIQFEYSTDGTTFTPAGTFQAANGGDTWYKQLQVDLSGVASAFNNPNFAFRVVTVFDPALGTAYSAATSTSTYAATGTLRFDMVTLATTPVPEPASLGSAILGSVVLLRRRGR